eukprot:1802755-Rhodomonas_salina.2
MEEIMRKQPPEAPKGRSLLFGPFPNPDEWDQLLLLFALFHIYMAPYTKVASSSLTLHRTALTYAMQLPGRGVVQPPGSYPAICLCHAKPGADVVHDPARRPMTFSSTASTSPSMTTTNSQLTLRDCCAMSGTDIASQASCPVPS